MTTSTNSTLAAIEISDWISQAEAARLRGVTRQAIARLVGNGRLRTLSIGGRSFVNRSDVLDFAPGQPGRPKATTRD